MKIVALYGTDELKARDRYLQIITGVKKRGWEHISLKTEDKISSQLVGSSLFGGERMYSCDKAAKIAPKEYQWLASHAKEHEGRLLLLFGDSVPAAIKKLLPKDTTYEEFKLQKELFIFLESIYPGNKQIIPLFHRVITSDPPELVLALLGRQLRDLAWVKTDAKSFGGPSWRTQKLTRQADKFSMKQLTDLVSAVSDADIKSKTGQGELLMLLDLTFMKYL